MRAEVLHFCREQGLFSPGDRVVCAVSGGADSMAMLWCLRSMEDSLGITVSAAHFNHHLRGPESQRDEDFVREFCRGFGIPCAFGGGQVSAAGRGLEDAARQARYDFLLSLDPGAKIATAHTADDNAETLLLHLLRGSGLDGLGGIPPVRGRIVRPLLCVTRRQIAAYLADMGLPHVEDSSNASADFLRNRLRQSVLPVLLAENPAFSKNMTPLTLRLRQDGAYLNEAAEEALERLRVPGGLSRDGLLALHPALRGRVLARFLRESGLREPASRHIAAAEALLHSASPSAQCALGGGLTLRRVYGMITSERAPEPGFSPAVLAVPGVTELKELGLTLTCALETAPSDPKSTQDSFLLALNSPSGPLTVRPRQPGDRIRLSGGSKDVKKIFSDRKIPAAQRQRVPILADSRGLVGILGIGPDTGRLSRPLEPALRITAVKIKQRAVPLSAEIERG